ncbi:MAG: DUF4124 domain-containing protein [Gammaproteobacteria bacterium]|nr:DUF4124 domain-containing protein [Gammaproteobacteria bacterium]
MKLPASLTATLLLATTLGAGLSGAAQAGLYKWTDEQGNVHYGDRIPPQYAEKEQRRLNEQGITVEVKERAKTPEELAEEQRLAKIEAEQAELRRQQRERDRILLDTFSNEDEIIMTRDGKVSAIDAIIRVTQGRIENLRGRLAELTTRAANLERSGKAVPANLHEDIRSARQQITNNESYIIQKEQEQQDTRAKYEADIQRFRELMRLREEERQKAEAR